jgi:hypothetical protein
MSQLETALRRLDGAVARLEATIGDGTAGTGVGAVEASAAEEVAALGVERDRLAEEVARLRAGAAEEARLRADAARAVRSALHDLRDAVGHGSAQGDG